MTKTAWATAREQLTWGRYWPPWGGMGRGPACRVAWGGAL